MNSNRMAASLEQKIHQLVKNCEQCNKLCLSQYDVTSTQAYTLLSLPHEDSLSMLELSGTMRMACSTMTRIVDPLVKKNLVERRTDEGDRRVVRVGLTEQGRELRSVLEKEFRDFFEYMLKKIRDDEFQVILNSLEKVNTAFDEAFKHYSSNLNS